MGERINVLWKQGVRLIARAAIAFALSTGAAIGVGVAATDNAFAQILLTALVALALWIPFFFIVTKADQRLARRGRLGGGGPGSAPPVAKSREENLWRQLGAAAPWASKRLAGLRRSLERSRQSLGNAELDPDAHELCILIDRRLPDLIHHELELLPPDNLHRRQKISELIELIEQFARHCSRSPAGGVDAGFEAEVLRRRFEARMTEY